MGGRRAFVVDYRLYPETPLNYRELTGRFPSPSWSPFFLLLVFCYTCILLPGMALGVGGEEAAADVVSHAVSSVVEAAVGAVAVAMELAAENPLTALAFAVPTAATAAVNVASKKRLRGRPSNASLAEAAAAVCVAAQDLASSSSASASAPAKKKSKKQVQAQLFVQLVPTPPTVIQRVGQLVAATVNRVLVSIGLPPPAAPLFTNPAAAELQGTLKAARKNWTVKERVGEELFLFTGCERTGWWTARETCSRAHLCG